MLSGDTAQIFSQSVIIRRHPAIAEILGRAAIGFEDQLAQRAGGAVIFDVEALGADDRAVRGGDIDRLRVERERRDPELRRTWRSEGAAAFQAELLERAPGGLGGLALARWLVERERAWVESFGGLRNTINAEEPKIVLDDKARVALDQERRSCAIELANLEKRSEVLSQTIYERRDRADDMRRWIKEASGFWGLFVSAEIKRKAEVAQKELPALREKISMLEDERRKVNDTLYALKRRLFLA